MYIYIYIYTRRRRIQTRAPNDLRTHGFYTNEYKLDHQSWKKKMDDLDL